MTNYVLGFAFSRNKRTVVLIEKQKPEFLKDKLTGVGGKVEAGESPLDAMYREFEEETGVKIYRPCDEDPSAFNSWDHYATVVGKDYTMYIFRTFTNAIYQVKSIEIEQVGTYNVNLKLKEAIEKPGRLVEDLTYLIPLALDENTNYTEINLKQ